MSWDAVEELQTQMKGDGPTCVRAVALALLHLKAKDPATVRALGESLIGAPMQTIVVAESLRKLSPASASQGEALTRKLWSTDLLVRTACLRALVEIDGAAAHADVSLSSIPLLQDPELSELALDGLESLTHVQRPLSGPFLKCATHRNTWPLSRNGWARPKLEDPWALEWELEGALVPTVEPLRRLESVRRRAAALLAK